MARAGGPARAAQAAKLCTALVSPSNPGYNPATYVGLFGGNFPIDIAIFQGTPTLHSETAVTKTLGFVLRSPVQSPLLNRMSLSVDYYNVSIGGGIATVLPQLSYQQCLNQDGTSNPVFANAAATGAQLLAGNPYCAFLQREPGTGFNRAAAAPYVNLGGIKTSGVDLQLDWSADLRDVGTGLPGTIGLNFVMSWLDKYSFQASPTGAYQNYTGTTGVTTTGGPQFKYKTFTTFTYSVGPGAIGIRWQHLPSIKSAATVINPTTPVLGAPSHDNFDLFASWKITDRYSLRGGVDNLFNTDPPIVGNDPTLSNTQREGDNAASTIPGVYDVLGRRFYVGVKARF